MNAHNHSAGSENCLACTLNNVAELQHQIWDLRNFLVGISMIDDARTSRDMAMLALKRNSEPGIQRGKARGEEERLMPKRKADKLGKLAKARGKTANLIATAPELAAFVQRQYDATLCICKLNAIGGTDVPCTHCEAEALLAKARGGTDAR